MSLPLVRNLISEIRLHDHKIRNNSATQKEAEDKREELGKKESELSYLK